MSSTNLKPGGEIDAFCTSCKADRTHRIIALDRDGKTPKKVECLSCKGHHLFRLTQAQKEAAAAHKRASKGEKSPKLATTSRASSAKSVVVSAKKREEDLVASWERAVTGKDYNSFRPYRIDLTFTKGDLVRHSKFGDGVVATIIDAAKVEVLFRDGPRTLAQAHKIG